MVTADYSYRCDDITCPFWIHYECATLPRVKLFEIHHKHPLQISDSLPQAYRQFAFKCKICKSLIHTDQWIFYCANCRFFAHIRCALQTTPVYRHRAYQNQPELTHLPSPDVSSMNLMIQKLLKDVISLSMDIHVAPPDHINHWAHAQHPLALKNTNVAVIVDDELKQVSESCRLCNGCTKPISSGDDVFYECNECNYFLHRYCAQFPQEIQHQHLGMLKGFQPNIFPDGIQRCESCGVFSNGFMFMSTSGKLLDVQCATLPQKFIYDGDNRHLLVQYDIYTHNYSPCKACGNSLSAGDLVYKCENCFTHLHWRCALWPSTISGGTRINFDPGLNYY
ncbi:uncharacterized protein LOC135147791 [Daucus carota subsp. sativus]|uniref:uncharacterized protein LOC135147791 n=1 Tax=Daucus carota subsp. sativus TaxID=79200 RepID=UPI003083C43F